MRKSVLSNKYNIPPFFIGITVLLCILPTVINLAGFRFGLASNLIHMDKISVMNELASSRTLSPLLSGRFIHTILVSFSISVAVVTVILAFVDYSVKKNISTPIVGVALFCAGMFDMIHILTSDQIIYVRNNTVDITSFTWLCSRIFYALIITLGVGIFLIQKKESVKHEYKSETRFLAYISIIFILLTVNCVFIVTDNYLILPKMIYPDMIVKQPYELLPLAIYLVSGLYIFPEFYRRNPSVFSQTLMLSLIPAIITQLHMAFGSSQLFDNHFFIAHYMKAVTYLVPFLGLSMNYLETHRNERRSIIELKKYQDDLELKIKDLNRSNRELEQFAYVASHDLQEPLRKIQAFGDRLNMKYSQTLGEDGEIYIDRMRNAASRMQVLIDDLLSFSRISHPNESFSEINIQDTVFTVMTDMEINIEKNKAFIQVDADQNIEAIPGQIRQLFQNMISNAIKFKKPDEDPVIQIEGRLINSSDYKELDKDQSYYRITISDNGIGFHEKYLDRIFIIFQRLHGRTQYDGTGIGLAICKKIVESHHGFITAESEYGKGTTFIVILPVKQPAQ